MSKRTPRLAFIIFITIMIILSLSAIFYIRNLLVTFEASQPEREVEKQIKVLKEAAEKGKLTELLSFDNYKPEGSADFDKEIADYSEKIKSGELSYEAEKGNFDSSGYVFDIKSGSEALARVTLESTATKTKLIVFNFQKWKVVSLEPAVINKSFDLPSALALKINGSATTGTLNEETGIVTYSVCSLTTPEIVISDVSGESVIYNPKKSTTTYSYTVSIPSNYTLYANDNKVDAAVAKSNAIPAYQYVSEYFDGMPTQLTYDLYFISNNINFKITDNRDENVDFKLENRKITVEGQAGNGALPDNIKSEIDVLEVAKLWSRLMTQDLTGANNGYGLVKPYLITGSYLQNAAWKWATSIDITFTSIHTLGNPPFIDEEVTDFVSYGDNAFSCTVRFKKHMILSTGMEVMDPMDSTLYFVKYDDTKDKKDNPRWLLVDISENVNEGGNK